VPLNDSTLLRLPVGSTVGVEALLLCRESKSEKQKILTINDYRQQRTNKLHTKAEKVKQSIKKKCYYIYFITIRKEINTIETI
jgi:glycine cleavage system pyridoxal-binding protein P